MQVGLGWVGADWLSSWTGLLNCEMFGNDVDVGAGAVWSVAGWRYHTIATILHSLSFVGSS